MASAPNPNANPNLSSANGNGAGPTPSSSSSSTPTPGAGAPNPRRMPSMSSERTISATRSLSPDGTNTTPAQPSIIKRAVQSTANKLSPSRRTSLISASGTLSTSIPAAGAVGNSTATSTSSATKMSASSGPGGTSSNASGSSRLASALRKSNKLANTPKNTSTASTTPQSSIRSTSTTATRPAPVTHASSESSDNDLEPIPSTPTAMFKSTPGMGATPSSSAGPRQTHSLARSHAAFTRPPMDGSLRQGTQTLIQALQAIPWENSDDEDDDGDPTRARGEGAPGMGMLGGGILSSEPEEDASDSESEAEVAKNEGDRARHYKLSSSIHTIHRNTIETPRMMMAASAMAPSASSSTSPPSTSSSGFAKDYFSKQHGGSVRKAPGPSALREGITASLTGAADIDTPSPSAGVSGSPGVMSDTEGDEADFEQSADELEVEVPGGFNTSPKGKGKSPAAAVQVQDQRRRSTLKPTSPLLSPVIPTTGSTSSPAQINTITANPSSKAVVKIVTPPASASSPSSSPTTPTLTSPADLMSPATPVAPGSMMRMTPSRSMSVATVRLKRRTKLAVKLREVFGIEGITEVVAELPCWLLRSILLQGYMYLTNSHLCFFAHMPSREDQVLKSGTMAKKSTRMKRWVKHWFVLKNDVLSWYHSSTDPYFPHGNIDLRYAISCDPIEDHHSTPAPQPPSTTGASSSTPPAPVSTGKTFKLRTNAKTITLSADSTPSRDEWVKAIRKVIFKAQNAGESVKIAIPYAVILDVEKSSAMDFSETVEVKVVDRTSPGAGAAAGASAAGAAQNTFVMDSYFFAYFQSLPEALQQIREVVKAYKAAGPGGGRGVDGAQVVPIPHSGHHQDVSLVVSDTTLQRSPSSGSRLGSVGMEEQLSGGSSHSHHHNGSGHGFSLTSLLRPSVGLPSMPSLPIPTLPNLLRRTTSPNETSAHDRALDDGSDPAHDYTHVLPDTRGSNILSPASTSASLSSATGRVASMMSTATTDSMSTVSGVTTRQGHGTSPSTATMMMQRDHGLTYPPSTPPLPPTIETTPSDHHQLQHHAHSAPPPLAHSNLSHSSSTSGHSHKSSWSGVVPSWLKSPSKRLWAAPGLMAAGVGSSGSNSPAGSSYGVGITGSPSELPPVLETSTRPEGAADEEHHPHRGSTGDSSGSGPTSDAGHHLGFSMLEAPAGFADHGQDAAVVEKFRKQFAMDEKEQLIGYVTGSLFRVLPLSGKMYVSTNYLCFRSSQPLSRTRMMLPLRDILSTERTKAFRFGHSGLIIIIKGHEELFFEFSSEGRRETLLSLLDRQLNDVRKRLDAPDAPVTQGQQEALILEELDSSGLGGEIDVNGSTSHLPSTENENLPAVMFTSMSSTFLSFKPTKPLRFTCLTIGSRGDVQPYIALCKGLKADGHQVRIATHVEYKEWIEGHGIEFGLVGGDPAELMRICVENGTFTVSFLKEGLLKFRGWVDDLLKTSWDACQGSDVLIECPSAMGGIHIAEAMRIPYFRAFTMPWTRTRAYPHAFAVPERKMGGSYNYMTYVMFDQVFWRATAGQINRWRRHVLGLESTSLDKMAPHKVPFLYNFSPTIVPPPLDWYEWIRVTGFWFLDAADDSSKKKWEPPEDLVKFIDGAHAIGKKVVYIGFGSIVVSDPEGMTRTVVEAIVQSGVYAILSKGWSDRLSTKKGHHPEGDNATLPTPPALPPQIYSIQSIPHDWLFPRIDGACHHGGAGTTGASLRAGIPTIIKPFFGDQFFWGDRVEAMGIGSSVRKLTVDHLAEALKLATTDEKQIERAKIVGEKIRAENGVKNAIEAIYRDLEYARSLIKPAPEPSTPEEKPKVLLDTSEKPSRVGMASPRSSFASASGSTEWSVISGDEHTSPRRDRASLDVPTSPSKRSSRVGLPGFSAIQDAFSIHRSSSKRSNANAPGAGHRSDSDA